MAAKIASRTIRHALLAGFACLACAAGLPTPTMAQTSTVGPNDIADVVERVKPAVVGVRTRMKLDIPDEQTLGQTWERLFGAPKGNGAQKDKSGAQPRSRAGTNQGSGFFISPDGYVVTTNHLVEGGETFDITTDQDKTLSARLMGVDPRTDLALLKVDADASFPHVQIAEKAPRIGEWVITVGNPFGLGGTVTAGIVSARARDLKLGTFNDFVQIDAPVNQGNSGGPTFDLQGNVIGVNSAIFSPTGGSVGIGFAVPAETVRDVVAKLRERGSVVRGWMGVQIQPLTPDIAEGFGIKETSGAVVVEPQPDSPAAQAGVLMGDVITAVDGQAVKDDRELVKRIGDLAPGATVSIDISRKGEQRNIKVTLAEMPAGRGAMPAASPAQQTGPARTARPNPSSLGLELAPGGKLGEGRGVVVTDVDPNGAGADRGVEVGDIILEVEGQAMTTSADVHKALAEAKQKGKNLAIARLKTGDSMRFVAFPTG